MIADLFAGMMRSAIRRSALPLTLACGMLSCHLSNMTDATAEQFEDARSSDALLSGLVPSAFQLVAFSNPDSSRHALPELKSAPSDIWATGDANVRPDGRLSDNLAATTFLSTSSDSFREDGMFSLSRSVAPLLAPPSVTGGAPSQNADSMRGPVVGGHAEMRFRSPVRVR